MAELPLNQAVIRFQGNEDRIDQFVNDVGGVGTYTTSGGEQVKTLPALEAEIEASKLSLAATDGSSLVGHTKADGTTITTVEQALHDLEGAGGGNVDSVNGQTGVVVLTAADVGAVATSEKGVAFGVATLDINGIVLTSQLPDITAAKKVTVADEVARLALPIHGDLTIAYQTDDGSTWGLNANDDPSVPSNWSQIGSVAVSGVNSFNGRVGNVIPQGGDYSTSQIAGFNDDVSALIGTQVIAGTNIKVEYSGTTKKTKISAELVVIRTPTNTSPTNGSVDVSVTTTLVASSYAHLYGVARQYREFQVDLVAGDFSSPVRSIQVDADSWMIDPALLDDTEFKWRCRDVDIDGEVSEWSESQSFTTLDIYVVTPVITSPTEGGTVAERDQPTTASAFQMVNSGDTHAASYWTIKNSLGAVTYQTGRDTVNLTSWQPPAGVIVDGESMTVEVVYESSGGFLSEAGVRGFVGVGAPFGKYLAVAQESTPFVTTYGVDVDQFTKLANPSGLPTGNGFGVAFSPDGTYMTVGHRALPYITIYKRSGDTFTKLAKPSVLPAYWAHSIAFSPDGTHMAIGHENSPYITIYKREGDTFTKLANPSILPPGYAGNGVAFSPDGTHMVVGHDLSPFITIYKREGNTFTKLANPSGLPSGDVYGVAFSPDGTHMAVAHLASPFITIYKREGDTFTKLANPSVLPTGQGNDVAFSPDGTYMSVAYATSPFVTIYKRSGDTFTKLANPAVLPAGDSRGVAFSSDGVHMAVAHYTSPFITIYKREGDTFTKLANPSGLPTNTGRGVAFWPSALYPST